MLGTAVQQQTGGAALGGGQGHQPSRTPARQMSRSSSTSGRKGMREFRIEFGPSRKDILNFTNQLAVMVRAGISLQESLENIAQQLENLKFKAAVIDLKSRIESGQSFSQALAEHPQIFSNLYINMVAAAEISGSLSDMLQKLANYLDQETETRSQVRGAMVYPVIIAVMAVSTTTFLLCFVLPKLSKDGVHYHMERAERIETYQHLNNTIQAAWRSQMYGPVVALCKESKQVRTAVGLNHDHCNCE